MKFFLFGIFATGIYLTLHLIYSLTLLVANKLISDKNGFISSLKAKFNIIIPAHNEEIFLPRLLESLREQEYPSKLFDILVVADNCSDATAEVAVSYGARTLERIDENRIGKGYAIRFALDNMDINLYDAMLIIDADSIVHRETLKILNQYIQNGNKIIQCYNGVVNPDDSWFTRLMDVSRTVGNEIFESSKEKLGVSSHLMGNGMCFRKDAVLEYGWDSFSVGEDWEYYAKIVKAGERVAFAKNARVFHQESATFKQATPQRMRWSSGRFEIIYKYGFGLFYRGLIEKNFKKIHASLPLLFPNPSLGINITVICFILSFLVQDSINRNAFMFWFFCLILAHFVIFFSGVLCTRSKLKSFLSLFIAPVFLIWKMGIDIFSAMSLGRKKWIRTARKLQKST